MAYQITLTVMEIVLGIVLGFIFHDLLNEVIAGLWIRSDGAENDQG